LRTRKTYQYTDTEELRQKILAWASARSPLCYLDSCGYKTAYGSYETLIAVGERSRFDTLPSLDLLPKDWVFGFLTYDVKNEIEGLSSSNFDGIKMPLIYFFQPEYVFGISGEKITVHFTGEEDQADALFKEISLAEVNGCRSDSAELRHRVAEKEYIETVERIREHIARGDIYEMNYCIEFYAENAGIDPVSVYRKLRRISPSPFSCFLRMSDKFLMCSSPERFLRKEGEKLLSQPIKGTIRRGSTEEEDRQLVQTLRMNAKEQSENVMIVDLVRNDLSRIALPGTVKVEELFGVYPFSQVHQMISTISCRIEQSTGFSDIIKALFPMGSMTGAPKIRAMELIERYESTKRGLYSGSVGYITPEGDFDLNVVIRSILYNSAQKYLSYMVGSAITYNSVPEAEYSECLLKGKALGQALNIR
jgi:para-aminobenzoate synthetase component I